MDNKQAQAKPFWETKTLSEMTEEEWESLCDGCAQCCRLKYKVEGSQQFVLTPMVCKLLDLDTCRCTSYENRHRLIPDCVEVTADNVDSMYWLPETCAYRLIADGKPLYDWHPLIAGNSHMMRELGISVVNRVFSERYIHPEDLDLQIVKWVEYSDE